MYAGGRSLIGTLYTSPLNFKCELLLYHIIGIEYSGKGSHILSMLQDKA